MDSCLPDFTDFEQYKPVMITILKSKQKPDVARNGYWFTQVFQALHRMKKLATEDVTEAVRKAYGRSNTGTRDKTQADSLLAVTHLEFLNRLTEVATCSQVYEYLQDLATKQKIDKLQPATFYGFLLIVSLKRINDLSRGLPQDYAVETVTNTKQKNPVAQDKVSAAHGIWKDLFKDETEHEFFVEHG